MKIKKSKEISGSYHTNQLCITLPPNTKLFDENNFLISKDNAKNDKNNFSVLIHEYYHYLHNFSTVSGFKSFFLFQNLLAEFSKTLNIDGTSNGLKILKDDTEIIINEIFDEWCFLNGEEEPEDLEPYQIEGLNIINISERNEKRTFYKIPMERILIDLEVEVTYVNSITKNYIIQLGDSIIDEGIAYEIDRLIAADINANGEIFITDNAHPFPYWLLRTLAAHLIPEGISNIEILACAKLALLTCNPAKCLISTLTDYSKIKREEKINEPKQILNILWLQVNEHIQKVIDVIINHDLNELKMLHKNRGIMEFSINYISELFKNLLSLRLKDPFYDLKPFNTNSCNFQELNKLLNSIVPCEIIQEREGDYKQVMRDLLISFNPNYSEKNGFRLSEILRPLQAQLHYLISHAETDFKKSECSDNNKCPFFTCCDLPNRKNNPDICLREPWKTYVPKSDNCWYGTAVVSTLGHVKVNGIKRRN